MRKMIPLIILNFLNLIVRLSFRHFRYWVVISSDRKKKWHSSIHKMLIDIDIFLLKQSVIVKH